MLMRGGPEQLASFAPQRLLILYFTVVGTDILGGLDKITMDHRRAIALYLARCQDKLSGGLQATPTAEGSGEIEQPTVTLTHCGLHVLRTLGMMEVAMEEFGLNLDAIAGFVGRCQNEDGSFGAFPGAAEQDVRFSYSAAMCWYLAKRYQSRRPSWFDEVKAVAFVYRCQTHEGGFAGNPLGSPEAHCGMTYCAVATLRLLGARMSTSGATPLCRYLLSRYGSHASDEDEMAAAAVGFHGRPNKKCDTCYSFWIGGALRLLSIEPLFDSDIGDLPELPTSASSLMSVCDMGYSVRFTSMCQDLESYGGLGKYSDVMADPMHTCLGLKGLALTPEAESVGLRPVHPLYGCTETTAASW